jgi:hypothetical protein
MIFKHGVVTGTAANIDITLGSVPAWVKLFNIDGLVELDWTADMPDAYGMKKITDGTISYISSLGITPLGDDEGLTVSASDTTTDGDTTTLTQIRGFRIGADTDVNVSGERIKYIAACLGHDSD